MSSHLITLFVTALVVSFLVHVSIRWIFPRIGLMDHPERYEHEKGRKPLPYPAGMGLVLIATLGIGFIDPQFWVLAPFILGMGTLSFLDDTHTLPAWMRFLAQWGVATTLFFLGIAITFVGNPFAATNFEIGTIPFIAYIITILWIIGVQNAMNFLDGLGGLSVGVAGVGFLTLGVLGLVRPELFFDPTHSSLTMANIFLAGICLGGFWFFWKKKIILGDTGSQVLGLLLATMSIFAGAKIATTLLVLGIPILDGIIVVLRRIFIDKKAPWKGDTQHIHHNLARMIGAQKTTLLLIISSAILGAIGLVSTSMLKMILLIMAFTCITGLSLYAYKKGAK